MYVEIYEHMYVHIYKKKKKIIQIFKKVLMKNQHLTNEITS